MKSIHIQKGAINRNFNTVTARSFGVPDEVNSGSFGVGIVIDFFGLSSTCHRIVK